MYEEEKNKLVKKIGIIGGIVVVFSVISMVAGEDFFTSVACSFAIGFLFYIPGRIKEIFGFGSIMTFFIGLAYLSIFIWLTFKLPVLAVVLFLLPIVDIGYSIYRLLKK